jgi:hypothetical protein
MSNHTVTLEAGDVRRAAAFLAHHLDGNGDGLADVLAEAVELHRSVNLLFAVTALFGELIPELRTPSGIALVREAVLVMAAQESA